MGRTDLRVALRSLLQRPLLTGIAVVTLALGIGANATIFSLVDGVAFRPLPVTEPGRLVALYATRQDAPVMGWSFPDYLDLRGAIPGLAGVAAYNEQPLVVARGGGDPQPAWSMLVSENYFSVLGVHADVGRLFAGDEAGRDGSGGAPVAVLAHDYYVRRFDADPRIVGSTVLLSGHPFTVIGVTPRGFTGTRSFSYAPDLWLPIAQHLAIVPDWPKMLETREWGSLHMVARLQPDAQPDAVRAAAKAAAAHLAAVHPESTSRTGVLMISNRTGVNPWLGTPSRLQGLALIILLGVVLVLLVACANVANLMLVRAAGRRRELAVRASLGASRWQLARQLLLESLLLAAAGGVAGLAIGAGATRLLPALMPRMEHPLALEARLDLRVILFAFALSLLSTLLFGLLPARRAAATDPADELRGAAGGQPPARRTRLLNVLVATQVAFSLVVLIAGCLFVRSLLAAGRMELGFRPQGALVFGIDASLHPPTKEQPDALERRVADGLRSLPGVTAVTWADDLPLDGNSDDLPVAPLGQGSNVGVQITSFSQSVGDDFFRVMGIPLRSGRTFVPADRDSTVERAVIGETLARRLFPHRNPIGERFELAGSKPTPLEVIGVVGDTKVNWLGESAQPTIYFDSARNATKHPLFVARQNGDRSAFLAAVRARVRAIDPLLPITDVGTMREHIDPAFILPRDGAYIATAFGLLALLLASCGIFGVIAYGVALRARELAIRVAVGARPRALLAHVLGGTVRLLAIGASAGLLGGILVSGLLGGLLYGVSPRDPLTLGIAVVTVVAVGLLATLPPALRVLRVDPSRTLRSEA